MPACVVDEAGETTVAVACARGLVFLNPDEATPHHQGFVLNAAGRLESSACAGHCLGVVASSVRVVSCAEASAQGWQLS